MVDSNNKWRDLYQQFKAFTMIWEPVFLDNLELCCKYHQSGGAVVECGVWRGGMIAAMAAALNDPAATYHLFDSFQGLPAAREIDGAAARQWQSDTTSPGYYNNCKADIEEAEHAMALSGAERVIYHAGWFGETLPLLDTTSRISILRLDADWYDSTLACMTHLYPLVLPRGLIIIDDYYTWDGCSRATP